LSGYGSKAHKARHKRILEGRLFEAAVVPGLIPISSGSLMLEHPARASDRGGAPQAVGLHRHRVFGCVHSSGATVAVQRPTTPRRRSTFASVVADDYRLLESMNKMTSEKYAEINKSAAQLNAYLLNLQEKCEGSIH
jgi:hypothetical protein